MQLTADLVKNEVLTFIERRRCPCGGELIFTGLTHLTYPPKFEHACDLCSFRDALSNCFPRITYSIDK